MSGITTLICGHSFMTSSLKEGVECYTCRQLKIFDWKVSRTVEGKNLRGYQIKDGVITFRQRPPRKHSDYQI
jgi:hypothetical protein